MYLLGKALGALLDVIFFVAALFFWGLYLIIRGVTIFVIEVVQERRAVQRAAKSDRG